MIAVELLACLLTLLATSTSDQDPHYGRSRFHDAETGRPVPFIGAVDQARPIELEGGKTGSFEVVSGFPGEPSDDYVLVVKSSEGRVVARMPLRACYGLFQVVAMDLLPGPPEELMVISQQVRGSPAYDARLEIWSPVGEEGRSLGRFRVGRTISTCGDLFTEDVYLGRGLTRDMMLERSVEAGRCPPGQVDYQEARIIRRLLTYDEVRGEYRIGSAEYRKED